MPWEGNRAKQKFVPHPLLPSFWGILRCFFAQTLGCSFRTVSDLVVYISVLMPSLGSLRPLDILVYTRLDIMSAHMS